MPEVKQRVQGFLGRYGMLPEDVDIAANTERFLQEMQRGLRGEPTPVLMLPTYLTPEGELPLDESVIVVDAGGTNFRVGLVTLTQHGAQIEHLEVFAMPGSQGAVSWDEFVGQVARRIFPLTKFSRKVGFCFSYAAEILPNGDGRVLDMSKQVLVTDAKGKQLGAELSAALAQMGAEDVRFAVLNDTVAAMLGGVTDLRGQVFDGFAGLIYGTGVNSCYAEKTKNIKKLTTIWPAENMIINMESGGFCGVVQGQFDKELDAASIDFGKCTYEKMVSGRYQGEVIFRGLQHAAQDGLLSKAMTAKAVKLNSLTLVEADAFCARPYGANVLAELCDTADDRETAYTLVERCSERAARLVTANLAAILMANDSGRLLHAPACIVAEGSTFYKAQLFQDQLKRVCYEHVTQTLGRHFVFRRVEHANLVGTAGAALHLQ